MQHTTAFSSLAFIMQGGWVTMTVACTLLVMSVASWYFIVIKAVQAARVKNALAKEVGAFWAAPNLAAALHVKGQSPAISLARHAVEASQHHQMHATKNLDGACSHEEFIARSMRRSMSQQQAELESGLSVLASVGSVAPFVGLFGTVWGIYHALASISVSGQATLDKVSGPVGEALIMTAIGLAVAIPAVLAYNAFVKSNRVLMSMLENFAQDLHTLLTTGTPLVTKQAADKMLHHIKPSAANVREVPA